MSPWLLSPDHYFIIKANLPFFKHLVCSHLLDFDDFVSSSVLWLTQLSPSVLLFIMSHICQWCFNNSWQIVTRTRDMGLGLLALVFRIVSFLIRNTACRNKTNCMDKCHHDSCHLIFISSSKPIYHFQTFSTLPSIRFCQGCFISCAVVVVDPAQSHCVIYFYLILCPIFASDVSTIADRLWQEQEIWH